MRDKRAPDAANSAYIGLGRSDRSSDSFSRDVCMKQSEAHESRSAITSLFFVRTRERVIARDFVLAAFTVGFVRSMVRAAHWGWQGFLPAFASFPAGYFFARCAPGSHGDSDSPGSIRMVGLLEFFL